MNDNASHRSAQSFKYSPDDNRRLGSDFDLELEQMSRINKEQEHEISTMKQKISSCNQENQALKDQVKRLNESLKTLKYKDLADSKLNITTEVYNKELKQLEDTLQRYVDDNKRLTMEVSRRYESNKTFENSMIQGTVDTEKKLLLAQKKNSELMRELLESKRKISEMENQRINDGFGEPFNIDESQIAFNPNQSQMKFGSDQKSRLGANKFGKKPAPEHTDLGITKFLNEDLSFIQEQPDLDSKASNTFGDLKKSSKNQVPIEGHANIPADRNQDLAIKILENQLSSMTSQRDSLRQDVQNLTTELQILRAEAKTQEDTSNEKNLIRKLKIENDEIRKLSETLQKKNLELVKEKNTLRLQLDDLQNSKRREDQDKSEVNIMNKTTGYLNDVGGGEQLENLRFKVRTLEQANLNLLKELREYKDTQNKSMISMISNDGSSSGIQLAALKDVSEQNCI